MRQQAKLHHGSRRGQRRMLLLLLLPVGGLAADCTTHTNPQEHAVVQEKAAKNDVKVLWTRPEQTSSKKHLGHSDQGLFVQRIAISASELLSDMEHLSPGAEGADEAQPVSISMYVDGCPGLSLVARSLVSRSSGKTERISIAQSQLPQGDLDITLTVAAFESSTTLLLRHDASRIFPITDEDRKGFHRVPADPASGFPAGAYIDEPECKK